MADLTELNALYGQFTEQKSAVASAKNTLDGLRNVLEFLQKERERYLQNLTLFSGERNTAQTARDPLQVRLSELLLAQAGGDPSFDQQIASLEAAIGQLDAIIQYAQTQVDIWETELVGNGTSIDETNQEIQTKTGIYDSALLNLEQKRQFVQNELANVKAQVSQETIDQYPID